MFEGLKRLEYEKGDVIFKENDEGYCAYLIESGSVEVSVLLEKSPHRIAVLGKDELFGEMALIDNNPRTASITALEKTSVIEISKEMIDSKLAREDPIIQHLLLLVLRRFRNSRYQKTWREKIAQINEEKNSDSGFSKTQKILIDQIKIASDISDALTKDEFRMYYQPVISVKTSRLAGFEALIRWQHPVNGFTLPDQFLKIAEETNQIVEIGNWVMNRVCSEFNTMTRALRTPIEQAPLFVGVNLSARQLRRAEEVAELINIVNSHGINPASIKLEITETVLIENPDEAHELLNALRNIGFHIVLDDFGTGFSSLSYLQKFAFDELKIDRSFVEKMLTDSSSMQIVNASIGLASALNLDTVAEGVETKEELEKLGETDCTFAQGYYIARPMCLADAVKYLQRSAMQVFQGNS